jgi:hypothetical protein
MEPALPFKTVILQLAFLAVGAVVLLPAAFGEMPHLKIEAHRLARSEILEWLAAAFRTKAPIEFRSREGHGCCDMGDTSLAFHADQTIYILRDGFVGTEFTLPYRILADGKISIAPTGNKMQADYLLAEDIRDFYVYRYGSSLYLVQESIVKPDLSVPGGIHWPLKLIPTHDVTH